MAVEEAERAEWPVLQPALRSAAQTWRRDSALDAASATLGSEPLELGRLDAVIIMRGRARGRPWRPWGARGGRGRGGGRTSKAVLGLTGADIFPLTNPRDAVPALAGREQSLVQPLPPGPLAT